MVFKADRYWSDEKGLLLLRYEVTVHLEEDGGFVEYRSVNGRKCHMKFYENTNGYLWTSLALKDGHKISGRINRLVYSNLKGEIPKGYQIDHIDRNKKNNLPENLRLTTPLENNANKDRLCGEANGYAKLTVREAREILELVLSHAKTKQEIAYMYNVSFATIKAIRSGRNWATFTEDIFRKYGIEKTRSDKEVPV